MMNENIYYDSKMDKIFCFLHSFCSRDEQYAN